MEVSGQLHTPAALPWYPSNKRVGGPQNWYGNFGEEKNILLLLPGFYVSKQM
jgi:hypothetical protein